MMIAARLHWGDHTGRGGWRGGKVAARDQRVADRDARTAQPARSARGAACTIIARALTLPHGPWGHQSAVRDCMTSTVRAAVRDWILFDCIERAARNRTACARCLEEQGLYRARPHNSRRPVRHRVTMRPMCGRIARPICPRGHGERARSLRAEKLEQVAHCPRGRALPSEVALSPRGEVPRGQRRTGSADSAHAGQARPWQNPSFHTLSTTESL